MSPDVVTLLWLGSEAWLAGPDGRPGRPGPVPSENPADALVRRLAEEFPGAAAVRILYQPAALAVEAIAPAELAGRRPGLRRRGCVWSVEAGPTGTPEHLLAFETSSPLPELARGFEAQGLRVEGAWTLASLLEAMPRGPEDGPAFLQLVIAGAWALLTCADAAGRRRLRLHRLEAAEELGDEIRAALATFDERSRIPAWATLDDEAWPIGLREAVRQLIPAQIPLAALFIQARRLACGGPADFLRPARRRFGLRRPVALGAIAALSLAALFAGWRAHEAAADHRRLRVFQDTANQAARNVHLAAAHQLEQINRALADATLSHYRLDLLLLALSRAVPSGICLREISSQGPDFLVRGRILGADEADNDPLEPLRRGLSADSSAWSWTETPPPTGREFLWRGRFREEAAVPARTPEEGAARLSQLRSQLPSRAPAELALARLTSGWTEEARSAPATPGRRSYLLDAPSRKLSAWSGIVSVIQELASEPGVMLTGVELEAVGDEATRAFVQARLELTLCFRADDGG